MSLDLRLKLCCAAEAADYVVIAGEAVVEQDALAAAAAAAAAADANADTVAVGYGLVVLAVGHDGIAAFAVALEPFAEEVEVEHLV